MLHDGVHFKDTDQVISSESTLKVKLLDRVKGVPGRVHGNKNGELRSLIKATDHRRGQYLAKVGRRRVRGDSAR